MNNISWIFSQSNVGLVVRRKSNLKIGYRITPYVELRIDENTFHIVKGELLKMGITCNYHKGRLHIQGIQNCLIVDSIIKDSWFSQCMAVYRRGNHTTPEGIAKLLALRDTHNRPNILRTTNEEVMVNIQ